MIMKMSEVVELIYNNNRNLQIACGDGVINPEWGRITEEVFASIADTVVVAYTALDRLTPIDYHNTWLIWMKRHGWKLGVSKDGIAKEHPGMVTFHYLNERQKLGLYTVAETVEVLKQYVTIDASGYRDLDMLPYHNYGVNK